ncbi:MAG: site-2 protease family protein [Terracidiphilus sp.]
MPLGVLACPACHALVYGDQLNQLAANATALEAKGDFPAASEAWNNALMLLPPDSTQAAWVRSKLQGNPPALSGPQPSMSAKPTPNWVRRLGPLGPLALLLLKGKGLLLLLFKLKFLLSFFGFIALYVALWGWRFGVGFAVCILIHEMGHYIDLKRRGLQAELPVFLPGLGAYVKWKAMNISPRIMAQISLAGPLAGWIAAAGCYLIYVQTGDLLWAALAYTGARLNVLNLIPVWMLDGGKAAGALGMAGRVTLLALAVGLWAYTGSLIFLLVAAGMVWRLFTKDMPPREDWGTCLYYAAVLAALAFVLHVTPDSLFPQRASRY